MQQDDIPTNYQTHFDDDKASEDSGWEGEGNEHTFNFDNMASFDNDEETRKLYRDKIEPTSETLPHYTGVTNPMQGTHPTKCPTEGRRGPADDRMAQSWPPRTPGPSGVTIDEEADETPAIGFSLDPTQEESSTDATSKNAYIQKGMPPRPPKRVKLSENESQTEPENALQVITSNHCTVGNPNAVFCTVVINGVQMIQCNVPKGEDSVTHAEVTLQKDVCLFGEEKGLFMQLAFYSPNFSLKPEFHIHGTLELLDNNDQIITTIYLGLLEDAKQIEKKQHTLASQPAKAKVMLSSIAPVRVGPNELQLVEEICDVLRNTRINPGRGSLPSVLVQHRAKESPLYEKVVGKYYQNSWHTFMKAHDKVFTLFHYSQKEIQERKLGPFAKFNEARIVLKEHESGDWRSADELAAFRHAQSEEGLRKFLTELLEKRDYDQRELLEVLHGNTYFNHFLSPTFSILMRTLSRHKGTFISSTDADQPTRIGMSRPSKDLIEATALSEAAPTTKPSINFNKNSQYGFGRDVNNGNVNGAVNAMPLNGNHVPMQAMDDTRRAQSQWNNAAYDAFSQNQIVNNNDIRGMSSSGMLVASAVPVQTSISQGFPPMVVDQSRNVVQLSQGQSQHQLMPIGGAPVQLLDQNAVVLLKSGQQQPQQFLPQFSNQQLLFLNQPSGSDASWVIAHQGSTQQELYSNVFSSQQSNSNNSTPVDRSLIGNNLSYQCQIDA